VAATIRSIFINPPIAIARLGGSSVPQDAYLWVKSLDPRADGETALFPTWSLTVRADGSALPSVPTELILRDGALVRPVCPFLEVWALLGEDGSNPDSWREVPLTTSLLAEQGASEANLTFRIDAHNLKAARRTIDDALSFGTSPAIEIAGDKHQPVALLATSPPNARRPMIPRGRNIPLGSVQIIQSRPNPADAPWGKEVDLDVIRLRFTPAQGRFYGPPQATATTRQRPFPAVDPANAFLDPKAGWYGARPADNLVQPSDTYDGAEVRGAQSLGVVDDTCEARIDVSLRLRGSRTPLRAFANVFVAPPDFGPDRRPFLSLADEINDRSDDAGARNSSMSPADRDAWIEDLFERVYDTVSLLNLDCYRLRRGASLTGARLAPALANDEVIPARQAMGREDALRNPLYTVLAPSPNRRLPLSAHARRQHRAISDIQALRDFISLNPGRIQSLVRGPFEVEDVEDTDFATMRMPPFMRQSNAQPLALSSWQYQLLIEWANVIEAQQAIAPAVGQLSPQADERRQSVLARLDRASSTNP
jgi:hypothetical protein